MDEVGELKKIRDALGCGHQVASELLLLSGGDAELAIECSIASGSLAQCKAMIIDERFRNLEEADDD